MVRIILKLSLLKPVNLNKDSREKIIGLVPIKLNQKLNLESELSQYQDKIDEMIKLDIKKIRITTMKNKNMTLCAVYITDKNNLGWKNQKRICFGGRNIKLEDAVVIARKFCHKLTTLCNYSIEIEDTIQCQQQEATIQAVV